uniref:G2/M-phase specific E3 ubiquitin protein ligase n=1 Tax=Oryzias sinensis TaxID=183150 RepID=A0A8C7Z0N4_9TELE
CFNRLGWFEDEEEDEGAEGCVLCRINDDDPALFGEKVTLKQQNLTVHYLCLLTSCGVYQRGKENEGILGFLVDDIRQEVRRSSHLTCVSCKKKGACVGCNVRSCRQMVHFPCGRNLSFISQFTEPFPSYCKNHAPSQSLSVDPNISLPQSCSVCLDSLDPVLSYSVLKCPSCHASWFHRDCVQRQAFSAGLFFFKCTLCNNKDRFQQEMLRMGIYIPERDASWELESDAYSDLLEVYKHCDSPSCLCEHGRSHSSIRGFVWFEVVRCCLCGSRGTHRKCSGLTLKTTDWACGDCTQATDGKASLVTSPQAVLEVRHGCCVVFCRPTLSDKSGSPEELLRCLGPQLHPGVVQVEVDGDQALSAGLDLVRRADFDATHLLSVNIVQDANAARQHFLKLLHQQIQDSVVFEGPCGSKNLALDAQALRDDLYFDVGCLLALCLVYGGPCLGFFSPGLYQCLFNYPPNCPLTTAFDLLPALLQISEAKSLEELRGVLEESWEFLQLAGCSRPISSLEDNQNLVEDLVSFTMITRMQLPLQRFREGLQTLGVFKQVQLHPSVFYNKFCEAAVPLTAQTLGQLFSVHFSKQEAKLNREMVVVTFWRHFLLECEVGRCSVSLQDVLRFSTGAEELPAAGLLPAPSVSFLHHPESSADEGLFPQSRPESRSLHLPITSTYKAFKSCMEQAISHHVHLLPA